MKKKIVVIGGGNGSALSICAFKEYLDLFEINAVVSMSDSGGSSGRLRKEFITLPAGDIMRAILAMSPYDYQTLKKIFHKNRFTVAGKLADHNLGNLFLVLAEKYSGDYMLAIKALEQALEACGQVYPVTLEQTDLVVELSNGDIIEGEHEIDRPHYGKNLKIQKAWLEPAGQIYPEAQKAIIEADYLIIGPGSFYSSLVATLLPVGVKEAISKSLAKIIYISGNAREIEGETGPEKLSEFISTLEKHLPRKIDLVVYNAHELNTEEKRYYEQRKWAHVPCDDENLAEYNVIKVDYEKEGGGLAPEKLGKILFQLKI